MTQQDIENFPIAGILGIALVVGLGVNAAIVVAAGAFAASKDDDDRPGSARKNNNGDAGGFVQLADSDFGGSFGVAVDGDGDGDDDDSFDLESILSLVEEAEADEVEKRISSSPGRDMYAPQSFQGALVTVVLGFFILCYLCIPCF